MKRIIISSILFLMVITLSILSLVFLSGMIKDNKERSNSFSELIKYWEDAIETAIANELNLDDIIIEQQIEFAEDQIKQQEKLKSEYETRLSQSYFTITAMSIIAVIGSIIILGEIIKELFSKKRIDENNKIQKLKLEKKHSPETYNH